MKGWAGANVPALNGFRHYPGPDLPDEGGKYVLWTRYGGPGEDLEGVIDDIAWQARVVGAPNNYGSAETAADALDVALLSLFSQNVAGTWLTRVARVGGAPAALMVDDGDRTHMVCSYIFGTGLALSNGPGVLPGGGSPGRLPMRFEGHGPPPGSPDVLTGEDVQVGDDYLDEDSGDLYELRP